MLFIVLLLIYSFINYIAKVIITTKNMMPKTWRNNNIKQIIFKK
jgi:hypothetical protein